MAVIVTKHAEERAKTRLGLNKKSVERQANLALERGFEHSKTKGHLNKWITKEALKVQTPASDYIVYNSHLFIFRTCDDDKRLITMIPIPTNISTKINNYIKK